MQSTGRKIWVGIAACLGCGMLSTLAIPFLVLGAGGIGRSNGESCTMPSTGAQSPTILGDAMLNGDQLKSWWGRTRRGQPASLDIDIAELIDLYVAEGEAEGVRGDLAWAQAVHETGYFTSVDVSRSNFAGIAHSDGATSGAAFADAEVGVRAHIQLLKKFAAGNDTQLANDDVAPDAGARATTWSDLAGRWASDPDYWTSLSLLYGQMRDAGGAHPVGPATDPCTAEPPSDDTPVAEGEPTLADVRGITVNASIAAELEQLLAAAEADGVLLAGDGYRSHQQQIELRKAHCGPTTYDIYEAPASSCSPPTARPGRSKHEVGLAIDFANCSTRSTRCWQWLNARAADYGFFNLESEPWHWSIDGS